jgi:hypothetical protein
MGQSISKENPLNLLTNIIMAEYLKSLLFPIAT